MVLVVRWCCLQAGGGTARSAAALARLGKAVRAGGAPGGPGKGALCRGWGAAVEAVGSGRCGRRKGG